MNVHAALNSKYVGYADYKDSGVEWLGAVPSHWTVTAVKRFASFTIGWTPPTGIDAYFGGDHLWANISDIGPKVLYSTTKTITDAGVRATRIHKSPKGSLLFSFKLSIGQVSIVGEDMYTNEAIATFKPSETVYVPFMYWAAPLFIPQNAEENIYGAKLLNQERIGNACFVLPSPIEQRTIAAFLDYETARIDSLIGKQQRLIELLKEKRQAVISHAVTKGINPDAPMKDSGVEWLGQVPEHWDMPKLKWHCATVSGGTPSTAKHEEYYEGGKFPWVRTTDLNNSELFETPIKITQKAINDTACSLLPKGSVLVAMYGGAGSIGKHARLMFPSTINQAVCGILPNDKLEPSFLHLYVEFYRPYWMVGAEGTRKDPNIGQDHIRDLVLACPPLSEQRAIVEYVDKYRHQHQLLEAKALTAIKLMQERRTALISAAVTGKIDLRGWTAPREG